MRIAWASDIHLNFESRHEQGSLLDSFVAEVQREAPDAVLIGGDIGEADSVVQFLTQIRERLALPVYFVLGNHDFYDGSIRNVRAEVARLSAESAGIVSLSDSGPIELTPRMALVGHGGWGDGRLGAGANSAVTYELNDHHCIEELANLQRQELFAKLGALGEEAAAHLRKNLAAVESRFDQVLILTHVPPFREAAWHNGRPSEDDWAPHFACRATGEAILESTQAFPGRRHLVLCGHSHEAGIWDAAANVRVWTAGATYGSPRVQRCFGADWSRGWPDLP